jgi:hypothetical protein
MSASPNTNVGKGALESVARLNPALLAMFASATAAAGKVASPGGIPWYVYVSAILLLVLLAWFVMKILWSIETPANIRSKVRALVDTFDMYGNQRSARKGLRQYLVALKSLGINEDQFALTNFYVCSANTAATFTPVQDGIVSPEAVRLALAAGARYLDISIYPAGPKYQYAPIVCEMTPGSKWRRYTMNEVSFKAIMTAVQQYAMTGPQAVADVSQAPYREDPLFLMLRFGGNPRVETFDGVADVLRDTIEPMRIDFTYNAGRGADRLFKTPITEFFGKVIIMSNLFPPSNNKLYDYINLGPRSSTPLELEIKDIANIPDETKAKTTALVQQNLTICRQVTEPPEGDVNGWDWKKAHALGIQFAALNFWSQDDNLKAYRAPTTFGVNSFLIKPAALRYVIEYIAPPNLPNPALNAGDGTPAAPQGLNLGLS